MALVDDDEVEELRWNRVVIDHGLRVPGLNHCFRGMAVFGCLFEWLALEERIHALNGADTHLCIPGGEGGLQALHVVEFDELAVAVIGHIAHELLFRLFAQIAGVHQEKNPLGVGVLQQAVHGRDGGIGFAGPGRHLNERAGTVIPERRLQIFNGANLTSA